MSDSSLFKKLQGISFLRGIDPAYLEQITSISEVCEYDSQEILFHEGEEAEYVYLVVSGKIVLELCPSTIFQKNLLSIGPGEMLGWSSFVEQRNYASTGVVVAPTQLIKIDGKHLRAICDKDPEFGYDFMHRIMRALAKRLTITWTQLANVYLPMNLPMKAGFYE
jgi:CRP/FNR family transcriptional regulator, cyclic AMP receptor protein